MEQLRSTDQLSITETLRSKLIENGIQRSNITTTTNKTNCLIKSRCQKLRGKPEKI